MCKKSAMSILKTVSIVMCQESKFDYFYLGANLKDFDLSKVDIRDDFKKYF